MSKLTFCMFDTTREHQSQIIQNIDHVKNKFYT